MTIPQRNFPFLVSALIVLLSLPTLAATERIPLKAGWRFLKADNPKIGTNYGFQAMSVTLDRAVWGDLSGAPAAGWCAPTFDDRGWTGTGECKLIGESVDGDEDKWYRFVAKIDLDRKTYRVSVYELESDFPSPGSARGKCVGQSDEIALLNPIEDGISSLEISAVGIGSTFGEVGFDPLQAQIDNIEVRKGRGLICIVK